MTVDGTVQILQLLNAASKHDHSASCRAKYPGDASPTWTRTASVVATTIIQDSGGSSVVVMESIQYRKRDDLSSTFGRDGSSPYWNPLTDSLMRPRCVEVRFNVVAEHASQMVFAEDDDVIQAFSSYSAKETLADRIHPRRAWRDLHDFDIGAFGDSSECRAVLGVAIPNQQLWPGTERSHLAQLLCSPLLRRCSRYAYVH